jgi:ASC-1-like (ASCH) protein
MANTYYMHLQNKYFQQIKNGQKNLELRLYDEKRRQLQCGDLIVWNNQKNNKESITTKITDFYHAENFFQLCRNIDIPQTGFNDKNELITALDAIYPLEKQQQYGVVAIELELI